MLAAVMLNSHVAPQVWAYLHGEFFLPHHGGISSLECDAFLHAMLRNSKSTLLRRYLSATKQTHQDIPWEQPCGFSMYFDTPRVGRLS